MSCSNHEILIEKVAYTEYRPAVYSMLMFQIF